MFDTPLFVAAFFLGLIFGLLVAAFIEDTSTDSYKNQIKMVIDVCESSLPRTQHCIIKGVVKE